MSDWNCSFPACIFSCLRFSSPGCTCRLSVPSFSRACTATIPFQEHRCALVCHTHTTASDLCNQHCHAWPLCLHGTHGGQTFALITHACVQISNGCWHEASQHSCDTEIGSSGSPLIDTGSSDHEEWCAACQLVICSGLPCCLTFRLSSTCMVHGWGMPWMGN